MCYIYINMCICAIYKCAIYTYVPYVYMCSIYIYMLYINVCYLYLSISIYINGTKWAK